MTPLTLLDEELALLVPEAAPLPWLDGLDETALAGALQSTARSLLVRGLARHTADGLRAAEHLSALVAAVLRPQALRLVVAATGQARPTLTLLRPCPGGVLVQDVSSDGVHLFDEVGPDDAADLVREALDPLAGAPGSAVVRVLLTVPGQPDEELLLVTEDGQVVHGPGDGSAPAAPVDPAGLQALAARLLAGLLAATPRAACG